MKFEDRFKELDQTQTPADLWERAQSSPKISDERDPSHVSRSSRIATFVTAAAISTATLALLWVSFRAGQTSPASAPLSATATVECSESGTKLITPEVTAQVDGVHILVKNQLSLNPGLSIKYDGGGAGFNIKEDGITNIVAPVPPGPLLVRCGPLDSDHVATASQVVVLDPDGIFVTTNLACTETASLGTSGIGADAIEAARRALLPVVQEGDVVQVAGYPEAVPRSVRLVRDGSVLAVVTVREKGQGTWNTEDVRACADLLPAS
jgi:hypothetical protein